MRPDASDPRAALRYRDWRLYQSARLLLILAYQSQFVAVGWEVYALTGQPLDLGLLGLARFLPFLALTVVGGGAADRFDRRRILLACYAGMALVMVGLFAYAASGAKAVWPYFAAMGAIGFATAFSGPASSALAPQLVRKEHFANAVTWASLVRPVATTAGPLLGGGLLAAFGATTVYATSAAMMAASAWLLAWMRVRSTGGGSVEGLGGLSAGFCFVWRRRALLGAFSLDLFAVLLGGATALLPAYARDVLHIGPEGLGLLRGAPAVGGAAMALILTRWPLEHAAGAKMFAAVFLFGLATVVFGLSTNLALSLMALVVMGAADAVSVVVRLTLEQIATPEPMRGRVGAVNMMFIGASNELGELESGALATVVGVVPAVVAGGVGSCAVALIWAALFPELRRVDRLGDGLPDAQPSPAPAPSQSG